MRQKTIRLIEVIDGKGIFGRCSCGGDVLYYTDQGVRCSTCGKLYGVWSNKRRALIQRSQELLLQIEEPTHKDEDYMGLDDYKPLVEESILLD